MASNPNFQAKLPPDLERNSPTPARTVRVGPNGASQRVAQNSWATRVQHFTLFANISLEDRSLIVNEARERLFTRGQIIHIEGDDMRQVVSPLGAVERHVAGVHISDVSQNSEIDQATVGAGRSRLELTDP